MIDTLNSHWMSALLETCPSGILIFDEDGQISWANTRMSDITGLSLDELKCLDRETASQHRLETLFDKPEKIELAVTGRFTVSYLECHYETLSSPSGETLRAAFYTDVTERCMLEARVERLNLSDDLTGTLNRQGLMRDLETLVSRSRRYHNHLSVMLLEFDMPIVEANSNYILTVSRCLRDQVRWADIIGRFADDSFLLLLPETDIEAAQGLVKKIFEQINNMPLLETIETKPKVYCGVSQWQRGNDMNMLLERVGFALASARGDDSKQFVAA